MIKKEMIAMLLAGGQGSRLGVLTSKVAKPAVSFGGKYRIIDFPLSNCINSGIDTVGVLTQYQPLRLNTHIGIGIYRVVEYSDCIGRSTCLNRLAIRVVEVDAVEQLQVGGIVRKIAYMIAAYSGVAGGVPLLCEGDVVAADGVGAGALKA